jgi:hypothetical protein
MESLLLFLLETQIILMGIGDDDTENKHDITLCPKIKLGPCVSIYEKCFALKKLQLNSVAWIRERTIPTERPLLVYEVTANLLPTEGATWSAWRIPTALLSIF